MINEELLNDFKKYLKKKNLSNNSITAYAGSVRLFFSMFEDITPENLQRYKNYLISAYRPATVNQRIYAINHFSRFMAETQEEAYILIASYHLPSVKVQQKTFLDTIISNEDYELLKTKLKEDKNYFWYFVVRFLAATGARVSELIQIKVEHLTLGYLDLYSKGGKVRRIYFPDSLCGEALEWCYGKGIRSGFLFLNKDGHLITPRGINFQLKHLARRYGINPDTVYPHSFRHRFAKNFLACFNDISLLADLMGHESIETTRIYLTRSSQEQQQLLDEIITW
ncbi:tyrosine-type recombinase/integrase [Lachnospiraceae bacterium 54-53]